MSFVLDALRKADADRERGAVPGIHAQPVPRVSSQEHAQAGGLPWTWIIAALAVGVALPLAWLAGTVTREAPRQVAAAPVAAAPVAPTPAVTTPAPPAVAAPAPAAAPMPAPAPEARAAVPASPKPASAAVRAAKPQPRSASAAAPAERVYAQHELPEEIRRQLPPISVNGSMYSPDRAGRFIVVNGQIFRENDQITPEVVLEQIKLKAAVLKYKGYRYNINY